MEVLTAEALLNHINGVEVYFPLRDIGVDLLAVKGDRHASIQVKESRYYFANIKGSNGHSWQVLNKKKFVATKNKIDFYVFLTYLPRSAKHKGFSTFDQKFIIVPTSQLAEKIRSKAVEANDRIHFMFNIEGNTVVEKRHDIIDYSEFLDRWDLIKESLK